METKMVFNFTPFISLNFEVGQVYWCFPFSAIKWLCSAPWDIRKQIAMLQNTSQKIFYKYKTLKHEYQFQVCSKIYTCRIFHILTAHKLSACLAETLAYVMGCVTNPWCEQPTIIYLFTLYFIKEYCVCCYHAPFNIFSEEVLPTDPRLCV